MRDEEITQLAINTIRTLAIDTVQQAKSGHPGTLMALGSADLYVRLTRFDPEHQTAG
jgi:transketolase